MTTQATQLPYYCFERSEHNRKYEGRYYNCNGFALAIVASVTQVGELGDWSAYIGADNGQYTEDGTLHFVAERGAKLREEDAKHFFPEITLPYRP